MNSKNELRKLNFKGQTFFIGIDVHKKSWKITIRTDQMELKTFSMNPEPKELKKYMNKNYPHGTYYSVYEAGYCGFWIHRRLSQLGFRNIVVNPADVPTTHKEKDQKRDAIDSRKLARTLEGGVLCSIYIPTAQQESLRSIARLYAQKVDQRKRTKQRIKSFLHFKGVSIPAQGELRHWSGAFIHWIKNIKFTEEENNYYLQDQIDQLLSCRKECARVLSHMRQLAEDNRVISNLRSIVGIGFITAFFLYAEIMDIKRFSNTDKLASFIGIVPSVSSSDDKEHVKGITKRQKKYLRKLLIESSWVAVRQDPVLTEAYCKYRKRMVEKNAIIRIARKLVNRINYVWKNEKEYVIGLVA